jgi:hypothetical protein
MGVYYTTTTAFVEQILLSLFLRLFLLLFHRNAAGITSFFRCGLGDAVTTGCGGDTSVVVVSFGSTGTGGGFIAAGSFTVPFLRVPPGGEDLNTGDTAFSTAVASSFSSDSCSQLLLWLLLDRSAAFAKAAGMLILALPKRLPGEKDGDLGFAVASTATLAGGGALSCDDDDDDSDGLTAEENEDDDDTGEPILTLRSRPSTEFPGVCGAALGSDAFPISFATTSSVGGASGVIAGAGFDTGDVTPLFVFRSRLGENIKFPVTSAAGGSDISGTSSGGASR